MIKPLCKIKSDLGEDEERADSRKKKKLMCDDQRKATLGVLKDLWFPGHVWTSGMGEGKENKSTKEQLLVIFPGRKRRTTEPVSSKECQLCSNRDW